MAIKKNEQFVLKRLRSKEERKIKALYTLILLLFFAVISLLSIHAIIKGPGSLFWDLAVGLFAMFSVFVLGSGVIFAIFALGGMIALPFVFFAIYLRNR